MTVSSVVYTLTEKPEIQFLSVFSYTRLSKGCLIFYFWFIAASLTKWDWYYCDPNLPITEDEYDDDQEDVIWICMQSFTF